MTDVPISTTVFVSMNTCGCVRMLALGSSVLKPNLDVSRTHRQLLREMSASAGIWFWILIEGLFKLLELTSGCSSTPLHFMWIVKGSSQLSMGLLRVKHKEDDWTGTCCKGPKLELFPIRG
jgi:hypothetical protein